jgi:hypothetical protein
MPEDTKRVDEARLQRPRSPRVPVDFSVELSGKTPGGESFQVQAEAIKVSRGGATLLTEAVVRVGDVVRLTPPFGRALDAEVNGVWTDETDGKQRIGVKLLDAHGWFAE